MTKLQILETVIRKTLSGYADNLNKFDARATYGIPGADLVAMQDALALQEPAAKPRFVVDKNPGVSDHKKHRLGLPHPWTEACEKFGCVNPDPHPFPAPKLIATRDAEWGKRLSKKFMEEVTTARAYMPIRGTWEAGADATGNPIRLAAPAPWMGRAHGANWRAKNET